MARRKKPLSGVKLAPPPPAAGYNPLGDGDSAAGPTCPTLPGQRVAICNRPSTSKEVMDSPSAVCRLLRPQAYADRESLVAVHLDAKHRVLGIEEIAKGTLSEVSSTPREVFKGAFLNNAARILLAHNHPSGVSTPSSADMGYTQTIVEAGNLLGVPVLDHVIVADDGCTSIRDRVPKLFAGTEYAGEKKPRRPRKPKSPTDPEPGP